MIQCSIKGCEAHVSELFSTQEELKRWVRFRACRCGAFDARNKKSCTCSFDGLPPTTYWPNLDWWILGGVEEVTLCPDHRQLVMHEIVRQQAADPTMDSQGMRNPTNKH